jgi:hypothetical protein
MRQAGGHLGRRDHPLPRGRQLDPLYGSNRGAKNTVTKLLVDLGADCSAYQNEHLRNLPCRRIQVDEIWSFTYAKAKNVPTAKAAPVGAGDTWTWTATALIPSWYRAGS